MPASVQLSSGVTLDSASSTQEALDSFAKAYDDAAAKKTQKVDAPPADPGSPPADQGSGSGGEAAAADQGSAEAAGRDDAGRFSKRAKSQDAGPEDVPRIKALTRQLREQEARTNQEAQARQALEQRLQALEQKPPAEAAATAAPIPEGFTLSEPQLASFPAYEDWLKSWVRWDNKREQFAEASQRREVQATTDGQKYIQDAQAKYHAEAVKFAEAHEDFDEVVTSGEAPRLYPLVHAAVLFGASPAYAYALAKDPGLVAELNLLAEGKTVNTETVASMQRVLAARLPPAKSAQAEAATVTKAKPPIKPVGGAPLVPEVPRSQLATDDYLKVRLKELREGRRR